VDNALSEGIKHQKRFGQRNPCTVQGLPQLVDSCLLAGKGTLATLEGEVRNGTAIATVALEMTLTMPRASAMGSPYFTRRL
jgi:hypothetical protein